MLTFALIIGKPYEGKLHVRFDEEVGETGKLGASSLLYLFVIRYAMYPIRT
ncbi:hypothetical protein [Cardinium endosymbiont of Bemisia tabaci]|uniref:hypothetical protein n=1 Tax=Cardinium endosymbiont of Bemisia tabaci TaxID=672794 RepID=UPI001CB92E82|nr:hypothetical protein [Cardinium endosymbiont of Bemisia tabaci]